MEKLPTEHIAESREINGIRFSLRWDTAYAGYTLEFDGITLDPILHPDIADTHLRLGESESYAQLVLDFATTTATTSKDVYDLYMKVDSYIAATWDKQT